MKALDGIQRMDQLLLGALDGLTDEQVAGPSLLPDWTRGHVLAHIAGVGSAVARQIENAVAGREPVDFYDGGQAGRKAAIEASARDTAAEHVASVRATLRRVEAVLAKLTPEVLDRPTGHRGRPVRALVLAWWREAAIHLTDLDLGVDHTVWDAALREHLVEHLSARVPDGVRLELLPTDDEPRSLGDGEMVTVRGAANDVAAWLAGRDPLSPLAFERSGAAVMPPDLGPWP